METKRHIRLYLSTLIFFCTLYTHSQIIYQYNKPVANYKHPYIYKGLSNFSTDIIGNLYKSRIFNSKNTYLSNIVLTVSKDVIYKGSLPTNQNIIYTYKENYLYKKGSTTPTYTYINNKLYKGSYIHPSNIIATTSSYIPIYVLAYLLE
jgi:hypothetical protein